jgi:hypothetical protein
MWAQPARLRRRRDLRGDGARARSGVCFYYVPGEGQSPSRFTNGRVARLEEQFVELTGLPLRLETFEDPIASWAAARATVDAGRPALLLTDLYYLDHYGSSAHFPGHAVVLAGYDDELAYLSDTGFEDLQATRLEHLERARPPTTPGVPARRPHVHGGRRGPARPSACRLRNDRPQRPADNRAGDGRTRGHAGAAPLRRRGRRLAGADRGLAVVGALLLPGDRAPGDRRRELQGDVLALFAESDREETSEAEAPRPSSGGGPGSSPQTCSRSRSASGRT